MICGLRLIRLAEAETSGDLELVRVARGSVRGTVTVLPSAMTTPRHCRGGRRSRWMRGAWWAED